MVDGGSAGADNIDALVRIARAARTVSDVSERRADRPRHPNELLNISRGLSRRRAARSRSTANGSSASRSGCRPTWPRSRSRSLAPRASGRRTITGEAARRQTTRRCRRSSISSTPRHRHAHLSPPRTVCSTMRGTCCCGLAARSEGCIRRRHDAMAHHLADRRCRDA